MHHGLAPVCVDRSAPGFKAALPPILADDNFAKGMIAPTLGPELQTDSGSNNLIVTIVATLAMVQGLGIVALGPTANGMRHNFELT